MLSNEGLIEDFLEEQKKEGKSDRTLQWHRENLHVLKKALKEQDMQFNIMDITENTIKKNYMEYALQNWGNKKSTINNRLKTFRAFWRFLHKNGYIKVDISSKLKGFPKEKPQEVITLEDREIERMINVCDKETTTGLRDVAVMHLLLNTGISPKEIIKLTSEDVLWDKKMIVIDRNGSKERLVPINDDTVKSLKEYLLKRGWKTIGTLFISEKGKEIRSKTYIERLEIISQKAGVEKQSSTYIWRNTFAKKFLLNGGDAMELSRILGNVDLNMISLYLKTFEISIDHNTIFDCSTMRN